MTRRKLLMIAFHFPPIQGSSGVFRTLSFARHLGELGWDVTVLTVNPLAYENWSRDNLHLIPTDLKVVRALAFDARRQLAIFGRYPGFLAVPDRWQSWIATGLLAGFWRVWRDRPDVIFSTYPIPSAHRIGLALHGLTGIPWVADFRDPMLQDTIPADPRMREVFRALEAKTFRKASRVVVTTQGTADLYRARYAGRAREDVVVIPNGFDEATLAAVEASSRSASWRGGRRELVLLHGGSLYKGCRNPRALFEALAKLREGDGNLLNGVRIVLRAGEASEEMVRDAAAFGLGGLVEFAPALSYKDALEEMFQVDGLIVMQGPACNHQVPGKIYEYLYAGKPILGMVDPVGESAEILRSVGVNSICGVDDADLIASVLKDFLTGLRSKAGYVPTRERVMRFSRRATAAQLGKVLDDVARERKAHG